MTGTASQIEWAERIKISVGIEFDRVTNVFQNVADCKHGQDRVDTLAIVDILAEERTKVLTNEDAGYFVGAWQELSDQVRQLLAENSRYQVIQLERRARKAVGIHVV